MKTQTVPPSVQTAQNVESLDIPHVACDVGSSPYDDVLVKLPSTSCAIVALDLSWAASVGWFRGMDVLLDLDMGLFVCLALLVPVLASAVCERFSVFSLLKLHGVDTFPLGFTTVAVTTLCMGCAAPVHPDPGPGSCIQLSPGFHTVAASAAHGCFYLLFLTCLLAFLKLLVIILDTGSSKRLKMGWAALFIEGLSDYVSLQVAFWCGGRAAAALKDGILKCCQALPAAARSRALVLPFVKDLEVVFSTVVSVMGQCGVMNSGFHQVRRADFSGFVLGLRFDEVLKPHREDGQVAAGCLSVGNGVQASGRVDVPGGNILTAMWGMPSNLENALTFRFCLVNAADFAVYDAAMSGHARRWLCLAMGCATARSALHQWLAALIAACVGLLRPSS